MRGGFTYLQLPKNLSQCLAVAQYQDDDLIEKWKIVVKRYKSYEYKANEIEDLLHPKPLVETFNTWIDLKVPELKQGIEKYALLCETSIHQIAMEMYEVYEMYYKTVIISTEKGDGKKGKRARRRKRLREWQKKLSNIIIKLEQSGLKFDGTPQDFP